MAETTYPFVDWTDYIAAGGTVRSRIVEDVRIGEDCWHNRGQLSQVVLFSSRLRLTRFAVAGPKAVGFLAENDGGEYAFYALFEDVAVGEAVRIRILLEGHYTRGAEAGLGPDGYHGNFAWVGPHVQRIVLPRGFAVASAAPQGGLIAPWHGRPAVTWRRPGQFWGQIDILRAR